MRLWHEALISKLPRQQLLGQHRECCALRGNGWGKSHATVNYVFEHPIAWLVLYHNKVIAEMEYRGYHCEPSWSFFAYRGKNCPSIHAEERMNQYRELVKRHTYCKVEDMPVYPEHNGRYFDECIANLRAKGIYL